MTEQNKDKLIKRLEGQVKILETITKDQEREIDNLHKQIHMLENDSPRYRRIRSAIAGIASRQFKSDHNIPDSKKAQYWKEQTKMFQVWAKDALGVPFDLLDEPYTNDSPRIETMRQRITYWFRKILPTGKGTE